MTNKIYVTPSVNETLQSLDVSDKELQDLRTVIDSLGQSIPQESRVVFADDTPSGGLRELDRNGWRIVFRYDPQQRAVMVADIRARNYPTTTKSRTEELAAAS
jgi:mRNA-degrading endonuclease RelE of RelBE toxin-antitoxin system